MNEKLGAATLVRAIKQGHCFIGFDLFGDSTGFSFTASNSTDQRIQGDEISLQTEVRLNVATSVPARIVLLKDGTVIHEENGTRSKEFVVRDKGIYRVEVYLPQLGHRVGNQPWIISNPIYVN
jgi:hypothetical protein